MDEPRRPLVLLTGAADGLGASIAAAFAAAGHDVVGLARSDRAAALLAGTVAARGGTYTHVAGDITQADAIANALAPHARRVAVLVHNAAAFLMKGFEETAAREFEEVWRVACLGAFIVSRSVLPHMAARGSGTVIFTGATAALRGGAKFPAFASAKFALRGLAQSLAREYGPRGVHVAHVILDGVIAGEHTERKLGTSAAPAASPRMDPDAIAQTYLALAAQPPAAWTHELDLRPFSERF